MQPILTFVHLSDSHVGPTRDFELYGRRPLDCLHQAVDMINAFPPDFVTPTGALVHDQSEDSYRVAMEAINRLNAPLYMVNGNHDSRALMNRYLDVALHPSGDPDQPLDYAFEVKGERFLVLDAYSAEVRQPSGILREEQLERVRAEAQPDGPPLTVFMHYPSLKMASPWLDERMLIGNGEALHAALLPARDRLRGVFFGHLHRSVQILRDGITYCCAPSTTAQYAWRLWDDKPEADPDFPPAYSAVYYLPDQVVVHQYAIPGA